MLHWKITSQSENVLSNWEKSWRYLRIHSLGSLLKNLVLLLYCTVNLYTSLNEEGSWGHFSGRNKRRGLSGHYLGQLFHLTPHPLRRVPWQTDHWLKSAHQVSGMGRVLRHQVLRVGHRYYIERHNKQPSMMLLWDCGEKHGLLVACLSWLIKCTKNQNPLTLLFKTLSTNFQASPSTPHGSGSKKRQRKPAVPGMVSGMQKVGGGGWGG